MKVSTKARYGLRGLFDIAFHNHGEATHVKDIARRQQVTPRYLEQIFQSLRREGVLASQRGRRGGYRLARPPEQISVGDVVRATEGPIELEGSGEGVPGGVATSSRDLVTLAWAELGAQIEGLLDQVTLADLIRRGEEEGLPRGEAEAPLMYFI